MPVARLGRYRLERVLGSGGMAVVYRARDEELERPVAIKLLADNLAREEAFRRRFLREARLAARLAHPNVVHVYDSGQLDGRPYIVMEYVEGETLADLLQRRGKLRAAEAVEIALQVCAGLAHAHAAGLVHRDIKPQNLLLHPDGTVKIADFGIARSAHGTRLTEIGSVLGTASYLAPEQAAGGEVTAAADIYALGAVCYQMLTARTPYNIETLTQLLVRQQEQPVTPVRKLAPDVPAGLEAIVMRCLARLPAYRPASAAALADQLAATVSELPTRPPRATTAQTEQLPTRAASLATALQRTRPYEGAPRREWSFRATKRLAIWVAATLVAIVLAVVALAPRGGGGPSPPREPASPQPPLIKPPAEQARDFAVWLRAHSR